MSAQPEALRLADALDVVWAGGIAPEAAAELRRLHLLNQELLEALRAVTNHLDEGCRNTSDLEVVWAAENVIAKAEGDIDASR